MATDNSNKPKRNTNIDLSVYKRDGRYRFRIEPLDPLSYATEEEAHDVAMQFVMAMLDAEKLPLAFPDDLDDPDKDVDFYGNPIR